MEKVENVTTQIILTINEQHTNDKVYNEIMPINNDTNQNLKTKKIWEYLNSKPELFSNIGRKILHKVLG